MHPQAEARFSELTALGLNVQVVAIGRKAIAYMQRRPKFNVISECGVLACSFSLDCTAQAWARLCRKKQRALRLPVAFIHCSHCSSLWIGLHMMVCNCMN